MYHTMEELHKTLKIKTNSNKSLLGMFFAFASKKFLNTSQTN